MKTPIETLNQATCNGMRELTEARSIEAIEAYHAQFQVTPSERERMILMSFFQYHWDNGFGVATSNSVDEFLQSDLYKSIPPARSVEPNKTIPSRESAEEWADNACCDERTDEGVWIGEYTLNAMMEMYDWIIERLGNETKEV